MTRLKIMIVGQLRSDTDYWVAKMLKGSVNMTSECAPDTAERIREYLAPNFRNRQLGDDDDIFALGFVTSLFAMQLVMFVEKEFGIEVASEDLEIENFRSIGALSALVDRKRGHTDAEPSKNSWSDRKGP